MSYNFTIQYCWGILNSADESSQKLNYMMTEQSKKCHENAEKFHELNFKQFWLILKCVDLNLINKLTF